MTGAPRSLKWKLASGLAVLSLAAAPVVLAQVESDASLPLKLERDLKAPAEPPRLIPLEILINGARAGDWVLLDANGELHATADAFEEWRVLRSADEKPFEYRGQLWYPLSSVPGYEARFLPASQSLELKFSPKAFAATRLATPLEERPVVSPTINSLFFNYDLNYARLAT